MLQHGDDEIPVNKGKGWNA